MFGRRWLFGADLHSSSLGLYNVVESTIVYDEVGVVCSEFRDGDDVSRRGVMTIAHACYLDETLFGVVCGGYLICAA